MPSPYLLRMSTSSLLRNHLYVYRRVLLVMLKNHIRLRARQVGISAPSLLVGSGNREYFALDF